MPNKPKESNMHNLVMRAVHTFWQSFLVVFTAGMFDVFNAFKTNLSAGKMALVSLVIAALAAGLSALKTMVVQTT